MSANIDVVNGLMHSFEEQDLEKALSFFNSDAI